jgi:hypothetical protein
MSIRKLTPDEKARIIKLVINERILGEQLADSRFEFCLGNPVDTSNDLYNPFNKICEKYKLSRAAFDDVGDAVTDLIDKLIILIVDSGVVSVNIKID